jgi:hypothetical protein
MLHGHSHLYPYVFVYIIYGPTTTLVLPTLTLTMPGLAASICNGLIQIILSANRKLSLDSDMDAINPTVGCLWSVIWDF